MLALCTLLVLTGKPIYQRFISIHCLLVSALQRRNYDQVRFINIVDQGICMNAQHTLLKIDLIRYAGCFYFIQLLPAALLPEGIGNRKHFVRPNYTGYATKVGLSVRYQYGYAFHGFFISPNLSKKRVQINPPESLITTPSLSDQDNSFGC